MKIRTNQNMHATSRGVVYLHGALPGKVEGWKHVWQLFANKRYFAVFYPMDSKAKADDALRVFC
jgi:hypothetical protein